MTPATCRPRAPDSRSPAKSMIALLLALLGSLALAASAQAVATPVPLGTTDSFAVLGGTGVGGGITNTGTTIINGDLGSLPNATVANTGTLTITGTNHGGDGVTAGAKNDLIVAYDNAAGQIPDHAVVAALGGTTLTPGVYNTAATLNINGPLTLDAGGDPNAVFVFQGSALTSSVGSVVSLIGLAQACNVYWQVGSSATLGVGSTFVGTLFALTSIAVQTNATVAGRVLARNGQVTLDADTITRTPCAAVPVAPVFTPTALTPTITTPTATTTTDTSAADAEAVAVAAQVAETARVTAASAEAARAEAARATAARATAAKRAAARKRTAAKRRAARKRATAIRQSHARPPVRDAGLTG